MPDRVREIANWTIDLPAGWFPVPMDDLDAHAQSQWIDEVVAQTREMAVEPGSPTALRAELAERRSDLLAQQSPWLNAAVLVRPEHVMSIGCILLTSVLGLDADDNPDAFQALLEEGFAHPGRGVRSHSSTVWQEQVDAGGLVGSYQRFEVVELGEGIGIVEDRTVFGLFPAHASEMIRLEFRTADLGTFADMIEETLGLVRTTRVALEEPA